MFRGRVPIILKPAFYRKKSMTLQKLVVAKYLISIPPPPHDVGLDTSYAFIMKLRYDDRL